MSADNLTGVWHGLYTYPGRNMRVLFDATLIDSGWLSGSTHEICATGPMRGNMICATLLGERKSSRVTFRKAYDAGIPGYKSVDYDGTLSADMREIEGRWMVSRNWAGKFLMIRSTGKEQAVDVKVFERI